LDEDSTLIYPPKNADDISVKITLCRKTDKKTGEPVGEGTVFTIMQKGKVQAIVDIKNRFARNNRKLMFHLDWVDPHGKSIYLKRIIRLRDDSSSVLKSSVSILPENREPGEYTLRIYYFRELIAEKKFELLPEFHLTDIKAGRLSKNIILCSKINKNTKEPIGVDSIFTIRENGKVRAFYKLINRSEFGNRELLFHFDWIGPNDSSFYRKQIAIAPDDTTSILGSSISVSPGKREPGEYLLRLYLFNVLIGEKKFKLIPEPVVVPVRWASTGGTPWPGRSQCR